MIPAGMIDRMLVSKTFTPDLPGRIRRAARSNIVTRSFPEKFKLSVRWARRTTPSRPAKKTSSTYRGRATDWVGL